MQKPVMATFLHVQIKHTALLLLHSFQRYDGHVQKSLKFTYHDDGLLQDNCTVCGDSRNLLFSECGQRIIVDEFASLLT